MNMWCLCWELEFMFTIHEWFISFCKLIMLPVLWFFAKLSVNCMCYFELSVKEWLSIYFYFCYFELHACVDFFLNVCCIILVYWLLFQKVKVSGCDVFPPTANPLPRALPNCNGERVRFPPDWWGSRATRESQGGGDPVPCPLSSPSISIQRP
jgi:hypothetical protein